MKPGNVHAPRCRKRATLRRRRRTVWHRWPREAVPERHVHVIQKRFPKIETQATATISAPGYVSANVRSAATLQQQTKGETRSAWQPKHSSMGLETKANSKLPRVSFFFSFLRVREKLSVTKNCPNQLRRKGRRHTQGFED